MTVLVESAEQSDLIDLERAKQAKERAVQGNLEREKTD